MKYYMNEFMFSMHQVMHEFMIIYPDNKVLPNLCRLLIGAAVTAAVGGTGAATAGAATGLAAVLI